MLSLKDIVTRQHAADVRFLPVSCSARDITIAAANLGDRPGLFGGFSLEILADGRKTSAGITLVPKSDQPTVKPNEMLNLVLVPQVAGVPSLLPTKLSWIKKCEYEVAIWVRGFDQKPKTSTVSCSCPNSS